MYNRYTNGSEAWAATQEAISVCRELEEAKDTVESAFEDIIESLDTASDESIEFQEECERLEKELEEAEAKYEELHATSSELITLLSNLLVGSEAVSKYVSEKLVVLGALNESSANCDSGNSSDGGG